MCIVFFHICVQFLASADTAENPQMTKMRIQAEHNCASSIKQCSIGKEHVILIMNLYEDKMVFTEIPNLDPSKKLSSI